MTIREIMHPAPHTIDRNDSLGEAHDLMRTHGIHHLPVMHAGKLVGILSERDLLEYRANLGFGEDWRDVAVSGAMTASPRTAGPDDSVTEVAGRFAIAHIGALPVVERGELLGIVTVADVLAAEVQRAMAPSPAPASTAADAMTPGPFTAHAGDDLIDAAKRMSTHGIRHLPVVDAHDHVIGMLSERDLRTAVGDPSRFVLGSARSSLHVRDAMTTSPVTVPEDRSIDEAARIFEDRAIGALPVLDREQRLVGILSYVDTLHALAARHA